MRPLSRQNLKPASISMHVFHSWCQLAAMCHSREEQHKGHSVRLAALRSLGCGNKQGLFHLTKLSFPVFLCHVPNVQAHLPTLPNSDQAIYL